MKNEELYYRTVNMLAKAYLNGTLMHANCTACAVGNIVGGGREWFDVVRIYRHGEAKYDFPLYWLAEGKKQIESTGYSIAEISVIEKAFESADEDADDIVCTVNTNGFLGLMAVVDALDIIHENTSSAITDKAKKQIEDKVVMEFV